MDLQNREKKTKAQMSLLGKVLLGSNLHEKSWF